jgi:hypothetical protein
VFPTPPERHRRGALDNLDGLTMLGLVPVIFAESRFGVWDSGDSIWTDIGHDEVEEYGQR